jgi:hypothetical protein
VRRPAAWIVALALVMLATPAEAGKRSKRIPNMPRNWAWPPTTAMKDAGARCLEDLDALGVRYERHAPVKKVATPIVVPDLALGEVALESIFRKGPFVMDCHLARGLAMHSPTLRVLGVTKLRFSQIHDYRTIKRNGRRTRILSRHAIGLAMDMYSVVLEDGTELAVERDYAKGPNALHSMETLIAGLDEFRNPLTPGNDPRGHDDHFHLEAQMPLPDARDRSK